MLEKYTAPGLTSFDDAVFVSFDTGGGRIKDIGVSIFDTRNLTNSFPDSNLSSLIKTYHYYIAGEKKRPQLQIWREHKARP